MANSPQSPSNPNLPKFENRKPRTTMKNSEFLVLLSHANFLRNKYWDPETKLDATFFALELCGEIGELANNVKKLEREALGLAGSRCDRKNLLEEIGDALICWSLLCNALNILPEEAI